MLMTAEQNLMVQMKLQNTIKDEDSMEYITPNKEYRIVVNRYDSSTISTNGGNRYIVETSVFDMLGTNIVTFKMNENDCLRLLDCLDVFINDIDGSQFNNYIHIALSPEQGSFFTHVFEVTRLPIYDQVENDTLPEYYKDYRSNDYRDIQITFKRFTPVNNIPISLFNFICSEAEYTDFMFTYFFTTLIDIDIPESAESIATTIINGSLSKSLGIYDYTKRPDGTYSDGGY